MKRIPPLYRLDILIAENSARSGKSVADIRKEIATLLGITKGYLWRLRNLNKNNPGMNTAQLLKVAHYFAVGIEDLINQDAYLPHPTSTSSAEEAAVGTNPAQS